MIRTMQDRRREWALQVAGTVCKDTRPGRQGRKGPAHAAWSRCAVNEDRRSGHTGGPALGAAPAAGHSMQGIYVAYLATGDPVGMQQRGQSLRGEWRTSQHSVHAAQVEQNRDQSRIMVSTERCPEDRQQSQAAQTAVCWGHTILLGWLDP